MKRGPIRDERLRDRFVLACRESRTLTEAAERLGVTRQRAQQLAKQLGITASYSLSIPEGIHERYSTK